LSEGLCVNFNASSTNDFSTAEYVGKQAAAVNPVLYDRSRGKELTTQTIAKKDAWFAKLDTTQPRIADCELHIHKFVQSHASGNKVSAGDRQIRGAGVLGAEEFNLFSLDQREVLTRMGTFPKVPVA
jgi:hypothetical protein